MAGRSPCALKFILPLCTIACCRLRSPKGVNQLPYSIMKSDAEHREKHPLLDFDDEGLPQPNKEPKVQELRKSLQSFDIFVYVLSAIIGSGIYISPALVARYTNCMGTSLIVWTISGIVCLFGALCFCEMAVSLRKTGNRYIFIKEAYGDLAGFCTIWAQTLIISPTAVAVISVTISEHVVRMFTDISSEEGQFLVRVIAVACAVLSCIINCVSTHFAAKAQGLFGTVQLFGLMLFIFVGIWKVSTGGTENYKVMFKSTGNRSLDFNSLSLAFVSALWSYDGWGGTVSLNEEVLNLNRDLRLGIITGIPFVIVCFLLLNLAFMSTLTHEEIGRSVTVATTFIERTLGVKYGVIVPIIVALSCFGSLNSTFMSGSRSILSASREGHVPKPLSYIHNTRCTPIPALLCLLILSMLWTFTLGSQLVSLVTYCSVSIWLLYGAALFGVIVLRIRRPDLNRPYKVWLIYPILTSLISAYFVIAPSFKRPVEFLICLITMLSALPVHFFVVYCIPDSLQSSKMQTYAWILDHFPFAECVVEEDTKVLFSSDKDAFLSNGKEASLPDGEEEFLFNSNEELVSSDKQAVSSNGREKVLDLK